jgi:hypothetical protein
MLRSLLSSLDGVRKGLLVPCEISREEYFGNREVASVFDVRK